MIATRTNAAKVLQARLRTISKPVFWGLWSALLIVIVGGFLLAMRTPHAPWIGLAIVAYVLGIFALALTGALYGARPKPITPATRRYLIRFMGSMMVYVFVLLGSIWLFRTHPPSGALAYAAAVAPVIPILGAIAAVSLYLTELEDEFERMIMVQSYIWATGLAMGAATLWGFLETFSLVPHLPLWVVFPFLAVCIVPATVIVRLRYR